MRDPAILNDIGHKRDGGPLHPVFIGVTDRQSYRGQDGFKHVRMAPAWLPEHAAHAYFLANEDLKRIGKRIVLESEVTDDLNSAGRTATQQKLATGVTAPPGSSSHEKDGALDVNNYTDRDVVAALLRYGFQHGDHGTVIPNDKDHFSFRPDAARYVQQVWAQRHPQGMGPVVDMPPPVPQPAGPPGELPVSQTPTRTDSSRPAFELPPPAQHTGRQQPVPQSQDVQWPIRPAQRPAAAPERADTAQTPSPIDTPTGGPENPQPRRHASPGEHQRAPHREHTGHRHRPRHHHEHVRHHHPRVAHEHQAHHRRYHERHYHERHHHERHYRPRRHHYHYARVYRGWSY